MIKNTFSVKIIFIIICLFGMTACASSLKYFVANKVRVAMPQVTAYLKPAIKNNEILITGRVVMQNLESSDLKLGSGSIEIKDESDTVIKKIDFDWDDKRLPRQKEIDNVLDIHLPMAMLNRPHITVFLSTDVVYKDFALSFPVKSKLIVLDMAMFKESIVRPLDVAVYTKIYTNISAQATANFVFDISNPTEAKLVLRKGMIKIYTKEKGDIAMMALPDTLFLPGEKRQIKDKMKLGNIFGTIITNKLLSVYPLRLKISGEMNIPDTDISMPFSIETVQELDFSLLPVKKR